MSSFQKYLDEQLIEQIELENTLILEFANIGPKKHKFGVSINMHIMQPDDKKLKHGPRIKFFDNNSNFSISISDTPKVIGKWKELVSEHELNVLVENVIKFKIPFLNFWYNSKMLVDDLEEQMEMVRDGKEVEATYSVNSFNKNNIK